MSHHSWILETEMTGRVRHVQIVVYDNLEGLRRASIRWSKGLHKPGYFRNANGVTQTYTKVKAGENIAIIRFARGYLSPEIVSHEVAHLAQHLYGVDMMKGKSKKAKEHMHGSNEAFAYLYGALFANVTGMLEELK